MLNPFNAFLVQMAVFFFLFFFCLWCLQATFWSTALEMKVYLWVSTTGQFVAVRIINYNGSLIDQPGQLYLNENVTLPRVFSD